MSDSSPSRKARRDSECLRKRTRPNRKGSGSSPCSRAVVMAWWTIGCSDSSASQRKLEETAGSAEKEPWKP